MTETYEIRGYGEGEGEGGLLPHAYAVSANVLTPTAAKQNQLLDAVFTGDGPANTEGMSGGYVVMAQGHHSAPHMHTTMENIIVVLQGYAATLWGPELENVSVHAPHDSIYIRPGVPHAAVNLGCGSVMALEARTSREWNVDTVLLPELDDTVAAKAAELQEQFRQGLLTPGAGSAVCCQRR